MRVAEKRQLWSERKVLHSSSPLLQFTGGPYQDERINHGSDGSQLLDQKQPGERKSLSEPLVSGIAHCSDIMRNNQEGVSHRKLQHLIVGSSRQAQLTRPKELYGWLQPQHSGNDVVVEIVISKKPRPTHVVLAPLAFRARSRCTTGLGSASTFAFNCSHNTSRRFKYSNTISLFAR